MRAHGLKSSHHARRSIAMKTRHNEAHGLKSRLRKSESETPLSSRTRGLKTARSNKLSRPERAVTTGGLKQQRDQRRGERRPRRRIETPEWHVAHDEEERFLALQSSEDGLKRLGGNPNRREDRERIARTSGERIETCPKRPNEKQKTRGGALVAAGIATSTPSSYVPSRRNP